MPIRVAINGFGRIGRNILRSGFNREDIEFVHINDLAQPDMLAYLLSHDSVHGNWGQVSTTGESLNINGKHIPTSQIRNPEELPWSQAKVDVVLECTGVFRARDKAAAHLRAGARKVIISAPGKEVDGTFVMGVNHQNYDNSAHDIVSNASCTTNCLAPIASVLHNLGTIESGLMTTVHSYTMDQALLDSPHPGGDFRRSRAAALNMIPTSTGAAKAISLVIPELAGRLNGMAIRVPTPNVSLVDLVVQLEHATTTEAVNSALEEAARGSLSGILQASRMPLVSGDINGNPHSSIADLSLTQTVGGHLVKVLSWYDNEWGFSNRMLDLTCIVGR